MWVILWFGGVVNWQKDIVMSAQLFLGLNHSATLSRSSRYLLTAGTLTALSLAISSAHAAGIEYSKQSSVAPFFEPGSYAELSYAYVDPKIEGTDW